MSPVVPRTSLFGSRRPAVVGHRGARGGGPENTPGSFRAAAALGAAWVELDVRLSADDVPVVIHDPRTEEDEVVRELDAEALLSRGVCSLHHVLTELPAGLGVDVEIKHRRNDPGWDSDATIAVRTAAVIERHRHERSLAVTSFDSDVLDRLGSCAPDLPRGLLTPVLTGVATGRARARELGCRLLAPHYSAPGLTADGIAGAHAAGLDVLVWTVNSAWRVRRLAAADVDAICTDDIVGTLAALPPIS